MIAWIVIRPTIAAAAGLFAAACLPSILLSFLPRLPWVLVIPADVLAASALVVALAHVGRRTGIE